MKNRFLSIALILCLIFALCLSGALGDIDYNSTYETAIKLASNDLTNLNGLQDSIAMLEQTGAYSLTRSYLMYFQALLELQESNDFDTSGLRLENCSRKADFVTDLQERGLPSCDELMKYIYARRLESSGDIDNAYAVFVDLTVLDSPDRAFLLSLSIAKATPAPTEEPTPEPTSEPTPVLPSVFAVGSWGDLQEAINAADTGATIELVSDLYAGSNETTLVIPGGKEITIDLKGHYINRACAETQEDGSVIRIDSEATVTILDQTRAGRIAGGNTQDKGGAIYISGVLIINGVTIEGNTAYQGGGIYVDSGAELQICNSTLYGNYANRDGGAIFNRGTLILQNCVIYGNGCAGGGAGIWSSGTATLESPDIHDNRDAINGGGIANSGDMTITGGIIQNNTVSAGGAGIFHGNNNRPNGEATLTVRNVTINNNTSQWLGGGIFIDSGRVSIVGTSVISGNRSQQGGAAVFLLNGGTLCIQDSPLIQGNQNENKNHDVFVGTGSRITISGTLEGNARIGIFMEDKTGIFTKGYSDDNSAAPNTYFFSNAGREVQYINGEAALN